MKKLLIFLLIGVFIINFASAITWDNIAYYKFDEAAGPVIDSVGTYNGTNYGATTGITGKLNDAYDFESGDSDYVNLSMRNLDTAGKSYSLSLWFKAESAIEQQYVSQYQTGNFGIALTGRTDSFGLEWNFFDGVWRVHRSNYIGFRNTDWHHLVAVLDDNINKILFYDDGVNVANATLLASMPASTNYLAIGATLDSGGKLDGIMDELSIWERALTTAEVVELYNSGTPLPYSPGSPNDNVTLENPLNDSSSASSSINFTASGNVSATASFNATSVTFHVWNASTGLIFNSTNVSLPGTSSFYNQSLVINDFVIGDYKWNVEVCFDDNVNTACATNEDNFTFSVNPFSIDAVIYNVSVYETASETFSINISANPIVNSVAGLFWYNGSSHAALITNPATGKYVATSVIDIPLQTSTGNMSFKWQFDFELTDSSASQQNTSSYSNEVNRTYIFLCNSTYASGIINFTTRNAENPFPKLNATFKSAWEWYLGGGTVVRNMSFEDVNENKSEFDFCGLSNNIDYIFSVDVEADAVSFSKNFYYFTEATKTSGTASETDLYLLNDTLSTPTTLLVRDRYQRVIENVLIFVQFYDVGTDTFYTVTMGKTNQNGEDIVYLNWYDSLYKFILVQNGTTILTTAPYKVGETPQIFQIEEDIVYDLDKFRDFEYSLYFNNITDNFVLTYIKPSGLVESGCLRVIKRDATGDTEICETCSTSASATLYCNIASAGNGTFIATFYATGSLAVIDWIYEEIGIGMSETIFNLLDKDDAAFYTILMSSLVLLIFLISPVFGIIGILAGLLLSSALGFSLISYGTFLFISCVGGLIIWLLRR